MTVSPSMPTGIGGIGTDGDLPGGQHGQSRAVPAAEDPRPAGRCPPDGDHAQLRSSGAAAKAGDVAHLIRAL